MYKFGNASLARLATVHEDLKVLAREVIKTRDCSVLCGHRTREEQQAAFESDASTVQYPNSKHNPWPSLAIDLAPYIPGVETYNRKQCLVFGGYVCAVADRLYAAGHMHHKIRWGGDWDQDHNVTDNRFDDLVHFELIIPES